MVGDAQLRSALPKTGNSILSDREHNAEHPIATDGSKSDRAVDVAAGDRRAWAAVCLV